MEVYTPIDEVLAEEEAAKGLSGTVSSPEPMTTDQELEDHLSALPPEQKEYMAAFMTPEFAQAVGILTGSKEVFDYLSAKADSSRVLLPLPREVAMQLLGQQEGQPVAPEQAMPTESPAGPQPSGVMADTGMEQVM